MRLTDFLTPQQILPQMKSSTQEEALEELLRPLQQEAKLKNSREAIKALLEREALSSTAVGQGVAIPHARLEGLEDIAVVLGLSDGGINFNAHDGKKTHIFFLILAPYVAGNLYLQVLARVSRLLKNGDFCRSLRAPHQDTAAIWQLLAAKEKQEATLI